MLVEGMGVRAGSSLRIDGLANCQQRPRARDVRALGLHGCDAQLHGTASARMRVRGTATSDARTRRVARQLGLRTPRSRVRYLWTVDDKDRNTGKSVPHGGVNGS